MTDTEIDELIAWHCGLNVEYIKGIDEDFRIPKYSQSLDAMHEAEKKIRPDTNKRVETWQLWNKYVKYASIVANELSPTHATARQKAEAFLRVVGKWNETNT